MSNLIFQFDYAKKLANQRHSMIEHVEYRKHLILPPLYLGNITSNINNILNAEKSRYSESLKGVFLAYENPELIHSFGTIVNEGLYLHCDVRVDVLIFKPTVGGTLRGIVNRIKKRKIDFLVHQLFEGSVAYDPEEPWSEHPFELGQELILQVSNVDVSNELIFIQGKILDIGKKTNYKENEVNDILPCKFDEEELHNSTDTSGKESQKEEKSELMEAMLYGCEANQEKDFIDSLLEESKVFGIDVPVFKNLDGPHRIKLKKNKKVIKKSKKDELDLIPILVKEDPNFDEFLTFASEENFLQNNNPEDIEKHPYENPYIQEESKADWTDNNHKNKSTKSKEAQENSKSEAEINNVSVLNGPDYDDDIKTPKKKKKHLKHKKRHKETTESSGEPAKKMVKKKKKREKIP